MEWWIVIGVVLGEGIAFVSGRRGLLDQVWCVAGAVAGAVAAGVVAGAGTLEMRAAESWVSAAIGAITLGTVAMLLREAQCLDPRCAARRAASVIRREQRP